jgi:hypothetical protein
MLLVFQVIVKMVLEPTSSPMVISIRENGKDPNSMEKER